MPYAKTRRVVCTGLGMLSPLGVSASKSWNELLNSRVGVSQLKEEHSYEGCQSRIAAYVDNQGLRDILDNPKHDYMRRNAKQLSRATTFAMLASYEALQDADLLDSSHLLIKEYRNSCGVSIGQGMVDFQDIYDNASLILGETKKQSGYRKISPFFITRALINMSSGNVCIRHKINGPNHCVSTACATGAHSIGDAFNYIKHNKANIMVCGSTEASINSLAIAGFERLRALCTKYNDEPGKASRPFDSGRCGFVMGEGAGILILEELEHARGRGISTEKIYGEILGYGMSSDSFQLTAPLPDGGGAKSSMRSAIEDANLKLTAISHVNAHATSTPLGDDIECNAIEDIFYPSDDNNSSQITVTSSKASIGHLLGGAGSVESIFGILSCKEGILPQCINLDDPLATPRNLIHFVRGKPQPWNQENRILMKNSFGFGGTNASIILSNFIE